MTGETNLKLLIKGMQPILNTGEYVFCSLKDISQISRNDTLCEFKEAQGTTIVINRKKADSLGLKYHYIAHWISLKVHSSLEAVGLTAIISNELAKNNLSCNIIAGYFHDHIFIDRKFSKKALKVLTLLSENYKNHK